MDWGRLKEKALCCRGGKYCPVFAELEKQSKNWGNVKVSKDVSVEFLHDDFRKGKSREVISKKESLGGLKRTSHIDWKKLREKAGGCLGLKACPVFAEMERQSRERVEKREGKTFVTQEKPIVREVLPELSPVRKPKEEIPRLSPVQKPKEVLPQLSPVGQSKEEFPKLSLSPVRVDCSANAKTGASGCVNNVQHKKEKDRPKIPEAKNVEQKNIQGVPKENNSQQESAKKKGWLPILLGAGVVLLVFIIFIVGAVIFFNERNKKKLEAEERIRKENEAVLAEKIAAIPVWTPIKPIAPVQSAVSSAHAESVEQPQKRKEVRKVVSLKKKKKVSHNRKMRRSKYCGDSDDFSGNGTESCENEVSLVAKSSRWNIVEHAYIQDGNKLVIDYKYPLPWSPKVEVSAKTPYSTQTLKQQVVSSHAVGKRLTIDLAESCPTKTVFEVEYWQ